MFCEYCGKKLEDEWNICPYCQQKVIKDDKSANIKEKVIYNTRWKKVAQIGSGLIALFILVIILIGIFNGREINNELLGMQTAEQLNTACELIEGSVKVQPYTEKMIVKDEEEPIIINQTGYMVRTEDNDSKILYPDVLNCIFTNNSGNDIKNVIIAFVAWDNNKLPIKIIGNYDYSGGDYIEEVSYEGINLTMGSKYGENTGFELDPSCNNIAYANAIVVSCEYFDGQVWNNPFYEKFKDDYVEKKLDDEIEEQSFLLKPEEKIQNEPNIQEQDDTKIMTEPISESETEGRDGVYIMSDSSKREISEEELEKLSDKELNLAINEIYARHERKFDSKELQDYFNSMSWYRGKVEPKDFKETVLSQIEMNNLKKMAAIENKRINRNTDSVVTVNFIGKSGIYTNGSSIDCGQIEITDVNPSTVDFTIGNNTSAPVLMGGTGSVIDDSTLVYELNGVKLTFKWDKEGVFTIYRDGSTGDHFIDTVTDGSQYVNSNFYHTS